MKSCNNNIRTASDGGQYKKVRVRVLGRGTCSKNKLQSPPQADRHRKLTIAVAKRLGRQMGAAHRKCTRVRPNCQDLAIRKWNVSSLTGKEHKLVSKAQQYLLDIVGTSSTKRRDSATVELNGGSTTVLLQQYLLKLVLAYLWAPTLLWVCRWLGTTGKT